MTLYPVVSLWIADSGISNFDTIIDSYQFQSTEIYYMTYKMGNTKP